MLFRLGVKEDPSEFYNYRDELEAFSRGLRDNLTRMIVVKGVRRIGKSSLIRVGLRLAGPRLYTIFDARAAPLLTIDTVYTVLAEGLSSLLERASRAGLGGLVREALERIEGVTVAGLAVRLRERKPGLLVGLVEALDRLAEREGEQVVLVFDEAQEFTVLRGFDKLLAHIYDYHSGVKLVLAGSEIGLLDRLLGRRNPRAALYGRPFLEISMERLGHGQSIEFLEKGFEELGVEWPRRYIEEAVDSLDGIPGWLTYYGYKAYTTGSHGEALRRTIEEGSLLVREELERFLAQRAPARTRYQAILRCLSLRNMYWKELKTCLETQVQRRLNNSQYTRYLRELQDYGFIEKTSSGEYQLADPLLRYAIRSIPA